MQPNKLLRRTGAILMCVVLTTLFIVPLLSTPLSAQSVQWQGPWQDNQGRTYWKGTATDGTIVWVWDNKQGEITWAWDTNGDGRYESWQEILRPTGQPELRVHHWDGDQDGVDEGLAWADNGSWVEKVWDSNADQVLDSWCQYTMPGCNGWTSATAVDLAASQAAMQRGYRAYLETAATGNQTAIKRAYANYQRAVSIFNVSKMIALRSGR